MREPFPNPALDAAGEVSGGRATYESVTRWSSGRSGQKQRSTPKGFWQAISAAQVRLATIEPEQS
jgi:hypothetical protein